MKNMNNQEKNTYVRQHILSALLELMKTQDFAAISIQELVDTAGVGRASFYRNFASKEDVLKQESVRLTDGWKAQFDREHPNGTPGQDNLWLISLLDFYKEHSEFYLAVYHAGLSDIMLDTLLSYFEDEYGNTTAQRAELDWLLYNKPLEYTQMVLRGEMERYLSLGCDHGRLED